MQVEGPMKVNGHARGVGLISRGLVLNLDYQTTPGTTAPYQRLKHVNLPSLELRRLHSDLVMCYKILSGLVKLTYSDFLTLSPVTVTRGHQYKLYVTRSYGVQKHFFAK